MITAADMEKLRLGVQNRIRVIVRGIEFVFRPLTIAETNEVVTMVAARMEKLLPAQRHSISESTQLAVLTLQKASELTKGNIGVTEDTLGMLLPDELGHLFREYNRMVEGCNPSVDYMGEAEIRVLAEEVKKNLKPLTELSFWQAVNLVRFLLAQT